MSQQPVKCITTKLPTYLEALFQEDRSISLVYRERKKHDSAKSPVEIDVPELCNEISELELTGTPLKIDLGGDDSVYSDILLERPHSWTAEEAQRYPLTLSEARMFIKNQLKLKKSHESVFCICDGNDPQHTVVFSSTVTPNTLTRTIVTILPCCEADDEITTLDYMQKDHIKSVRRKEKVQLLNRKNYNLFGYNLKNCSSLQSVEYNGNISVEVLTSDTIKLSQNVSGDTMNFQVVMGHGNSPVNMLWEELCFVQSYIHLLEAPTKHNDSSLLNSNNDNCLDCGEVTSIISEFVNTVSSCKKITHKTLDLKNLRQLNILDKLWDVLQRCRTLSDLRDSFHFFFEELAEIQTKVQIVNEDKSAVAEIVNGILDGRIAVPTVSFSQSLELLIELGLEKLKNDYLVIINNFYAIAKEAVLKKWTALSCESAAVNAGKQRRTTRISLNPKLAITDLISSKHKLSFLHSMHAVSELIFLYKNNLPPREECFDCFCEGITKKFIVHFQNVVRCYDLTQPRLCEFLFNISSADAALFIKDNSPVAYLVMLSSVLKSVEVSTVFHFSQYPIFPPSIYENYDIPFENDDTHALYVTKLVKYTEHC